MMVLLRVCAVFRRQCVGRSFLLFAVSFLPYVAVVVVLLESGSGWGLLVIVERETERQLCVDSGSKGTVSLVR